MSFSPEKKREIIIENYKKSKKRVKYEQSATSEKKKGGNIFEIVDSKSTEGGCGDSIRMFISFKLNKKSEKTFSNCFFYSKDCCLVTTSFANLFLTLIEKKKSSEVLKLIKNCYLMLEGKDFIFDRKFLELEAFSDISNFSHRIECIKIVLKPLENIIRNK
jgi:NifU-like protein involved in Fe-S cluster formation